MNAKFIEVTSATVVSGGAQAGPKVIIGVPHIVMIRAGTHNTSIISLANGKDLNVAKAYDKLKADIMQP